MLSCCFFGVSGSYYEGNFKQGHFHGAGTIVFPHGKYNATWDNGKEVEGTFVFNDDLVYSHPSETWSYLTPEDRRFHTEGGKEIKPAGVTQMSNTVPVPELKGGIYDAGDGVYDPKTGNITEYGGDKVIRKARADEAAWLQAKGRFGTEGREVAAHRRSLESR